MPSIKSTTQNHLDIAEIKNNFVILNNGGACAILETNAINFDLLSPMEQDAAIVKFSGLLNSLSFPIQITIRSKRMDISDYLEKIREVEEKQTNTKIRTQIAMYRTFIKDELVTKEAVLDKDFYVTVPHKTISISSTAALGWVTDLFGMDSKSKNKINVDAVLQEAVSELAPRVTFLVKALAGIDIKAKQLTSPELIKLFYDIYNSETSRTQRIRSDITEYSSVLVEPKIA